VGAMHERIGTSGVGRVILALVVLAAGASRVSAANPTAEDDIHRLVDGYARAIETKDVGLFRTLKPNLSGEEERRLARAFASVRRQQVTVTIESIRVEGEGALVRLSRRDVLDGSIVSSFPQTLRLARARQGWTIEEIGR
jgi:hypothetical protein